MLSEIGQSGQNTSSTEVGQPNHNTLGEEAGKTSVEEAKVDRGAKRHGGLLKELTTGWDSNS